MFQFTWPLCTPPMFKFGPRGFQNWFYIHCSSNQKKVPSAQTFFAPNRSKLGKWTIQNHCGLPTSHLGSWGKSCNEGNKECTLALQALQHQAQINATV